METHTSRYAVVLESSASFDSTVEAVRQALMKQGFGILSEIDVSATLQKKLDVDYPRTLILGACNPSLALRALTALPDISVFLPCNVVIRMHADKVEVAVTNTLAIAELMSHPEIDAVVQEVDNRLRTALDAVASCK